jgi:hypothetical protein
VLLGSDGLGDDQTLSRRTINEGGLQRVCNHSSLYFGGDLKNRPGLSFKTQRGGGAKVTMSYKVSSLPCL